MKKVNKILSAALSIFIVLSMFSGLNAMAENNITVDLDGKQIEFDVNPQIVDGRTMVPLRKIFEEIGALVKWDNDTQTVCARKNSKTISLTIGSNELSIDKGDTDDEGNPILETVTLDVSAQIVSGRTLVPARAISESFGLNVDWDGDNQKVIITSDDDADDSWKENVGRINLDDLTYEGEGIEISENQIKITAGGDFTLSGTLTDGNITVSAKEKVKLRLSEAKITSSNNPCIFIEDADKAYITLTDGTENVLVAENSEDGAIYSKENFEIKGDGTLIIESKAGHGIKASDNLNIENGSITINAASDGIHINDTFNMTGGTLNITAINDGIDSESIINITDGIINVETNGTPVEASQTETQTTKETTSRGMWEADEADVEFEKSTKGINAEWMIVISGGKITVNSASHAIHCQDEIEINGGKFTLSSKYDKGISAHGNLTVNGADTVIDVTKSTEGIESKNVLTINDGTFSVVSSDDAINATGGNNGMMMPGGNANGGEFTPPEGFERNQIAPNDAQTTENKETQALQGTWPQRGGNGRFQNMQPALGMTESGEAAQPAQIPENGIPVKGERPAMPDAQKGTDNTQTGGDRMPGGFMGGGMGGNMKECLIINGGYIELYGEDDCLDANGNLVINGGTVKATKPNGSFYGAFGIVDPDGQTIISENATIIFAAGSASARGLNLKQNTITVNCENNHNAGDKIMVSDSNGDVIHEYTPEGSYKAVLIASGNIKTGEKYTIAIGEEAFETEIAQQSTIIGEQTIGGMEFDRGQRMQ